MNFKFKIANKTMQALANAKARYKAQGYSVTVGTYALTAIKGIYKIWEGYHNNGQKAYICNYKNGKQDGKQEGWNEDGTETAAELWKDDKFIKNI